MNEQSGRLVCLGIGITVGVFGGDLLFPEFAASMHHALFAGIKGAVGAGIGLVLWEIWQRLFAG